MKDLPFNQVIVGAWRLFVLDWWKYALISLLGVMVEAQPLEFPWIVLGVVFSLAFSLGGPIVALKRSQGQEPGILDFFVFFKRIIPVVGLGLIYLVSVIVAVGFIYLTDVIGMLVILPLAVYFGVSWSFAIQVVMDRDQGALSALKTSQGLVKGAWWGVFAVVILITLVSIIAYLTPFLSIVAILLLPGYVTCLWVGLYTRFSGGFTGDLPQW